MIYVGRKWTIIGLWSRESLAETMDHEGKKGRSFEQKLLIWPCTFIIRLMNVRNYLWSDENDRPLSRDRQFFHLLFLEID